MKTIMGTWKLYAAAGQATGRAMLRAPAGLVGLLAAQASIVLAMTLFAPLGLIGGFIVGFIMAAAAGAYLHLLDVSLTSHHAIGWGVIRESMGRYVWEVIGVMFVFWIGGMALEYVIPDARLLTAVWLVVFVLFNPAPEMIYQRHNAGSMALLSDALSWVKQNGPEWFAPMVVLGCGIVLFDPDLLLPYLQAFGPRFDFINPSHGLAPVLGALGSGNPLTIAIGILVPVLTHLVMLFRGALFKELGTGGRRSRAWQSQF